MRRARIRRKLKLVDLVKETGISLGMLSMLERGVRHPGEEIRRKVEGVLGLVPEGARAVPSGATPEVGGAVAAVGACLAVLREVTISDLALAANVDESEVRAALRMLTVGLTPLGMRVIDDGTTATLQPAGGVAHVPAVLTEPAQRPELTELQMAVLMMAVHRDGVTSEELETLRGVNTWSVLDSLRRKGFVAQAPGSFSFRPTRLALDRLGVDSFEELRALAVSAMPPELLAHLPDADPPPNARTSTPV